MKTRPKKKSKAVKNTHEESGYISKASELTTNDAEDEDSFHPFHSAAEPGTKIKAENYTDRNSNSGLVANMVKSELVEFCNNDPADIFTHQNSETVMLEKIPKTEVDIFHDGPPSFSNEQDDPYNIENSDAELDPFGDIDLDPSFSQTTQTQSPINDIDWNAEEDDVLIGSADVSASASASSNPSPSIENILPSSNTAEHNDPKPRKLTRNLQCKLCLETQSSGAKLKTHIGICSLSHKNRIRFCVPCNKLLCSREKYVYHALHRHGIEEPKLGRYPLNCQFEFCHRTFALKESLVAHVTLCHNKSSSSSSSKTGEDEDGSTKNRERFKCTECPSTFKHCCDYIRHMQCHKNERSFKCPMPSCERSFNFSSNLKEHLKRIHSEEKPHKCPEPSCGFSFKGTAELKKHMVRHSDARPWPCSESGCIKTFKTKDRLSQHVVTVHRGIRRVKKTIENPKDCPEEKNCK